MTERVKRGAYHHPGRSGRQHIPLHHRRRQTRAPVAEWARFVLPTASKKPTITAMEEVRRGLVNYDDPDARNARCSKPPKSNRLRPMNASWASAAALPLTDPLNWPARSWSVACASVW